MSVRAVEKSLETSIADKKLDEEAINEYISKFYPSDPNQSDRLQEELVTLYNANSESKQPPAVLVEGIVRLVPVLTTPKILSSWFESLIPYAVDSSGINNQLVDACRAFISEVLNNEDTVSSAKQYIKWLLDIYVGHNLKKWIPEDNILAERLRFIRYNSRTILLDIFPKAIETISRLLNRYVLDPRYRILALQLLSEAVSKCDQSKLYKIIDFEIFDTLYVCLENDQSPIVLSIAATTLSMIMPHVCDKLVPFLPRSYACFGRISSWYRLEEDSKPFLEGYEAITSNEDEGGPNNEPLYMVLYGLFPNNTLAFCRSPDAYLKKHDFKRVFDDFWSKPVIQHSAEALFGTFLLHPGLIQSSEEQEIATNTTRWQSYRSTVDIITKCVDMRVSAVIEDSEQDEKTLDGLLGEHIRLFKTSLSRSTMSPLLGSRSRSASRPNSRAVSRAQSPMALRPSSAITTPIMPLATAFSSNEDRGATPIGESSPMPPPRQMSHASLAATQLASQMASHLAFSRESTPKDDDSLSRRVRSKSQPAKPSPNSMTPMSPGSMASPSPALQPVVTSSGSLVSSSIGVGGVATNANYLDQAEYYFRELLLMRNELDFVNFNKHIIENKLVQLQKKLAQLDIANIRVGNLEQKNKKLSARLSILEKEQEKAQRGTRTLLKQRTSYESTILEKNKDFRQQISLHHQQVLELEQEIEQQKYRVNKIKAVSERRGAKITELELSIAGLQSQIDEMKAEKQEEDGPDANGRGGEFRVNDDLNEVDAQLEIRKAREIFQAKFLRAEIEAEGVTHDYETRIAHLESERDRLQQMLRDQELKLASSAQFSSKYDATRRKITDMQARVQTQYETLRHAHDDLLKRYSEAEHELRARRIYEEERMNEFKTTMVTTQPFQRDSELFEVRPRGDRGGAQKR